MAYVYSAWMPVGRKHDLQEERRVLRAHVKGDTGARPMPYQHKRGAAIIAHMQSDKLQALKAEIEELKRALEMRRNVIVLSGREAMDLDQTQECEPLRAA